MPNKVTTDTHPFIDFGLNLERIHLRDWILLGEACSKIAHVINIPLNPETAQKLHVLALVRGVRATTAIEGNTLSEDQVHGIVKGTLNLPPSRAYQQQEVKNVVDACNALLRQVRADVPPTLNIDWLLAQNALVLRGLGEQLSEEVIPGEWRKHNVGVARYRAPAPTHVPVLMERFFGWLDELQHPGEYQRPLMILRAILAHLYIAWIHPFGDGNGRSARLLEYALLLQAGLPSPSAHLLSNHYNNTRDTYYRELDKAGRAGDPYSFIHYSLQGLVDGLNEQIQEIQKQQTRVIWTNMVYEVLAPQTEAQKRRARLAIALGQHGKPIHRREAPGLTRRLAQDYAGKGARTLSRDLTALAREDLVQRFGDFLRANLYLVQAFKPFTADKEAWTNPYAHLQKDTP